MAAGMERWNAADGDAGPGLRFWRGFLGADEAAAALEDVTAEGAFPWDEKPRLFGHELPQHAYRYRRRAAEREASPRGLGRLEALCGRLEADFGCKVGEVYCNRFADPAHEIVWHKDTYGSHIFVLSLGGSRGLEFRVDKTQEVTEHSPLAGDLYFMSLDHNERHHHRVLAARPDRPGEAEPRVSFVFFASAPHNLPEYRVGMFKRLAGAFRGLGAT